MYGPHRHFAPLLPHTLRRIPQAVGVVATNSEWSDEVHCGMGEFQYRKR